MAALIASSKLFFSSGSPLRMPTPTPAPSMPPVIDGPTMSVVLEFGLLERADEGGRVRQNRVDAAGREVEVVGLGGLVFADLGRALEVLVGEVRVDRRALDADGLALQDRLQAIDGLLGGRLLACRG